MLLVATGDGIRDLEGGVELAGHHVRAAAAGGRRRWAIVDRHQVQERSAEGDWSVLTTRPEELTCLAPGPGGLMVGAAGPGLGRMAPEGFRLLASLGEAPTRSAWYTPDGSAPEVRSMAVAADGALYVNVHVGGILRSDDAGASWVDTIDLHADVHQVICPSPIRPGLVLAACADGLAQSRDAGVTWALRDAGLRRTYCRAVALAGGTVLVSASAGPGGAHAGVYRVSLEGKDRFERCRRGLPERFQHNIDTGWLVADDDQAALVASDGRVFVSADEGASWDQAASGLCHPSWLALS